MRKLHHRDGVTAVAECVWACGQAECHREFGDRCEGKKPGQDIN